MSIKRKAKSFTFMQLKRAANKSTKLVGMAGGTVFPFYYVTEYPKSGGTWLSRMVADALQVPFPQHNIFPTGFSCVIQNHWCYSPRLGRTVYLYRDGRDVMTSFYFFRMKRLAEGHGPTVKRFAARYQRLFGSRYDPDDSVANLPRFIEAEFSRPMSARLNWTDHVDDWIPPAGAHPSVYPVSYEELHDDCVGCLQRVADFLANDHVDRWLVQTAAYKFSMSRQTGRRPGEEDRRSFIRKGIVGDWVNHFSREAAEVFNDLAGPTLLRLGYVADTGWAANHQLGGTGEPAVNLTEKQDVLHHDRAADAPTRAAATAWSSSPLMLQN